MDKKHYKTPAAFLSALSRKKNFYDYSVVNAECFKVYFLRQLSDLQQSIINCEFSERVVNMEFSLRHNKYGQLVSCLTVKL